MVYVDLTMASFNILTESVIPVIASKKKSLELLTEMIISLLDATSSLASINKIESLGEAHNFLNGLYY